MTMAQRFDGWVAQGDLTLVAIARFRILYALIGVLLLPSFSWVAAYPDTWFHAPIGPMMLFDAFPSVLFLNGLELALAIAYACLLLGWRTTTASWAVTLVSFVGYGFVYSLGKIDHGILFVILPPVMALAGWGARLSVDSLRREDAPSDELATQWPLRGFALLTGIAFLTAALPKLGAGWLSLETQAVQATLFRQYYVHGRDEYLAEVFVGLSNRWLWESMDYFAVGLEAGFVVAALLAWRAWRAVCAVAVLFHVGVLLMMNIAFFVNVVAYAAFVRFDLVPVPAAVRRSASRLPPVTARTGGPLAVVVGAVAYLVVSSVGNASSVVTPAGVLLGGLVAVGYLVPLGKRLWRGRDDKPAPASQQMLPVSGA